MTPGEGLMRLLSVTILISLASQAGAGPACPSLHRDLATDALFHKATIIGAEDNRETIPEYAKSRSLDPKDVEKKFAATGVFHCGGYSSSANLVHKKNKLALSAHQFFEKNSCTKKMGGDFSSCYVEITPSEGAKSVKYKINPRTLTLGTSCPNAYASDDWAVVDLLQEVKDVQPFRVADIKQLASAKNDYEDLVGLKTTTIARRNDNFKNHPYETSSLCDGTIGGIQDVLSADKRRKEYFIASNCSSGHGNSGGGVLIPSGDIPTLIGIVSGGRGKDYLPFGPENFTSASLVEGRLYDAITK